MVVSVEEVSSSLVREYLSRKGLKRTIACMDEEHPRTEASINNRSELRQILHLEGLYRKNKAQKTPLKTLLEIMVNYHIQEQKDDSMRSNESDVLHSHASMGLSAACGSPRISHKTENNTNVFVNSKTSKLRSLIDESCSPQSSTSLFKTERLPPHNLPFSWVSDSENRGPAVMVSSQESEIFCKREPERKAVLTESSQKSRANRLRRGVMAAPVASTLQDSNKKRLPRRSEAPQSYLRKDDESKSTTDGIPVISSYQKHLPSHLADYAGVRWGLPSAAQREPSSDGLEKAGKSIQETGKPKPLASPKIADVDVSEMVLDDVDDEEDWRQLSKVPLQACVPTARTYASFPMDQHAATELKEVLFGSSRTSFSLEWRNQSFAFSETHDLRYGIVQKKGGPCGVLASIQGFFLKKLLFENSESSNTGLQRLRPSNTTRRKCLVSAMAEILWRAGEEKQATLALGTERSHFTPTGHYRSEGVLEKVTCVTVDDIKDLHSVLEQHVEQYESGGLACILLTISAVLSRSVQKVKADMDVPTNTLIGAHGYCTQELVNLLLCGRAVSNVFDNDMELDSGNGNTTLLKGVKSRCDIGLLSLFEHYNICKVGAHLKDPHFPIWVVCSESHFSVLFGLQMELLTSEDQVSELDLYYYDGLANQQEEIRLTISVGVSSECHQDPDLIPPLEHCIRTRWKDASVSWNDTEPIL